MRLLPLVTFQPPSLICSMIYLPNCFVWLTRHLAGQPASAGAFNNVDHQKLQLVAMQPQLAVSWHSQKINSSTGRGKGCGPKGGRTFFSGFANQFFCNKTLEPQQKLNGEVGFVKSNTTKSELLKKHLENDTFTKWPSP